MRKFLNRKLIEAEAKTTTNHTDTIHHQKMKIQIGNEFHAYIIIDDVEV